MRMLKKIVVVAMTGAIAISGCGGDSSDELISPKSIKQQKHDKENEGKTPDPPVKEVYPVYDPSRVDLGSIPLPSDVLFVGTPDGTLNIPHTANYDSKYSPEAEALDDPLVALNTMDGFGVTTDLLIRFSDDVEVVWLPTDGLRIFEMDTRNPWPVRDDDKPQLQVEKELLWGADFVAYPEPGGVVRVVLAKPLKPYTTYLVAVTRALPTVSGEQLEADPTYRLLQSTEPFVFRTGTEQPCDYTDVPDSLADCTDLNPAYEGKLSLKRALDLEGHRQATNTQLRAIVNWAPEDDFGGSDFFRDPPERLDYTSYEEAADHIVLSYGVTTQKAGYALKQAFRISDKLPVPDITVSLTAVQTEKTQLYGGILSDAVQFVDPKEPNQDIWEAQSNRNLVYANGMVPVIKKAGHEIPVLVSVPTGDSCPGELSVAIFQHDILRNRADLRRVSDALAGACVVGVAIDLPKHGIAPQDPDDGALSRGAQERLVPVTPGQEHCLILDPIDIGTPGKRCPSGDGFINGGNLANTRDTVRQAIVDMYSLYRALIGGALKPDEIGLSGATLDTEQIHFVGHGYGASLGIPFIANAIPEEGGRRFGTITFNGGPGGGLFRMLDGSPMLDDLLLDTIDAPKPSPEWDLMILIGQTLLDSVNEFNAVRDRGLAGPVSGFDQAPILAQEILGYTDSECYPGARCADPVIPNNLYGGGWENSWYRVIDFLGATPRLPPGTAPALLAGTDPIVQGTAWLTGYTYLWHPRALNSVRPLGPIDGIDTYNGLGLTEITQASCDSLAYANGWDGVGEELAAVDGLDLVRFIRGSHDSLLGTDEWPAVTDYMRDQITEWIASGGTRLLCDPARWGPNAMLRRE